MPDQTPTVGMERKLAAIFSTDVAGYSRLMGDDEEATIRTLTAYRAVISSLIRHHRGRVVDSPGDNLLAEFASVVDAVRCAIEIQQALKGKNDELPPHRQMHFRIGINLGDVIVEGERLYGDGVNIAARLESLAIPGGICISGTVHDHVENKLALTYENIGEQSVKNIAKPVRVYRVQPEPSLGPRPTLSGEQPVPLSLPDKPSIAVLPFTNMSSDAEQEYFSDGLTEDLITDLSRLSGLLVIARHSTFTYKGKAVRVQEVSRELGVQYVLEGSVRKAGERVRITAQLVEATTGHHLWAERCDRPLTDIFALQDEIVQKIVTTLRLQLTLQERGYSVRKHTDNLEAYDALLRGLEYFYHFTQEANTQARQWYEKATTLDPQYAEAYAWLGATYRMEQIWGWSTDPRTLEHTLTLARQALALDDSLPIAHSLLSMVYTGKQQSDQAIVEGELAIALDPNHADSYALQAEMLNYAGRPEEALRAIARAMRLNPRYPPWYLVEVGWAYRLTGRYTEAVATIKALLSRNPNFISDYLHLALSYQLQWVAQQGPAGQMLEEAVAAVQRALDLSGSLYRNHLVLGYCYLFQKQYVQALAEIEQAVALAPTEAGSSAALAAVLSCVGRMEDALEATAQALRLKSEFAADDYLAGVGTAYAVAGHYEEARVPLQRFLTRYPSRLDMHLMLAAVYSELGQTAEAQKEAAEVLRLNPKFSLEVHKQRMPIKDPTVLERHIAALRKAGLK